MGVSLIHSVVLHLLCFIKIYIFNYFSIFFKTKRKREYFQCIEVVVLSEINKTILPSFWRWMHTHMLKDKHSRRQIHNKALFLMGFAETSGCTCLPYPLICNKSVMLFHALLVTNSCSQHYLQGKQQRTWSQALSMDGKLLISNF